MADILNRLKKTGANGGREAVVGDRVVASSSTTQKVEGNHYFAPETVNWDLLEPSPQTSVCHWKGVATYYDVVVDGDRYPAAAWTYEDPSGAAASIKGHVAFWRGVRVASAK